VPEDDLPDFILDDSRDLETNESSKTRFKQPENGVRLSSKPTLKNKRNKTREKHRT
jgi:hypothetical protein